jgi:hypothetical protein
MWGSRPAGACGALVLLKFENCWLLSGAVVLLNIQMLASTLSCATMYSDAWAAEKAPLALQILLDTLSLCTRVVRLPFIDLSVNEVDKFTFFTLVVCGHHIELQVSYAVYDDGFGVCDGLKIEPMLNFVCIIWSHNAMVNGAKLGM